MGLYINWYSDCLPSSPSHPLHTSKAAISEVLNEILGGLKKSSYSFRKEKKK